MAKNTGPNRGGEGLTIEIKISEAAYRELVPLARERGCSLETYCREWLERHVADQREARRVKFQRPPHEYDAREGEDLDL